MALIHPLFRLIASRPQMIADHVEAYSALIAEEVGAATSGWKRRLVLGAVGLCCAGVALVLGGVALMLWACLPIDDMRAPWALLAVPGVPALGAIGCYIGLRTAATGNGFKAIREQLSADAAMLREVST
jgi:uncharacterized membrane protein YqjE